MDGVRRQPKNAEIRVPVYIPLQDVIDQAQPHIHFSCDWLSDPLALGLLIFRLGIYRQMEELQHGHLSS